MSSSKPFFCSVIVTTYNWPGALKRVLESLKLQNTREFEVIIADDGSSIETAELIQIFKTTMPVPLHHVWQPDVGFRAAGIRNKAILKAKGDYIIFLDGDCIVNPNFVLEHCALAESYYFVSGNRVLLSAEFTKKILDDATITASPISSFSQCFKAFCQGHINRMLPFIKLPRWCLRKMLKHHWQGAKACNLGAWKSDLFKVNGWEENFQGWGYEDSDLVVRLIRSGVFRKMGNFRIPVIHLWHKENDRSREKENRTLLEKLIQGSKVKAEKGLDQTT